MNKASEDIVLYASSLSSTVYNDSWIVDSGATAHMCGNEFLCSHFRKLDCHATVQVGDRSPLQAVLVGDISLKLCLPDGTIRNCTLLNYLMCDMYPN